MSDGFWFLFSTGMAAAMTLMTAAWLLARRLGNAGIGDIARAFSFVAIAGLFYVLGEGSGMRKLLVCGMAAVASLRLGVHLAMRTVSRHPREDGRYVALREQYPRHTWLMFFGLFELQALLIGILSVPFAMACTNGQPELSGWEWAGLAIWLPAMLGEAIADSQLLRFRSRPENEGKVCRFGLWRYSRHPNYFFQWLQWVAYFVFALGTADGWIAIYCPALMLFFLLRVTGIPATEAHALRSRGDAYRAYQRSTSAFVPWFSAKS